MKGLVITYFTPTKDNFNGISALLYHLIKGRDHVIKLELYTFNANDVPTNAISAVASDLNINIHTIPYPDWHRKLTKSRFTNIVNAIWGFNIKSSLKLQKSLVDELNQKDYDFVWLYQYYLYSISKQLKNAKCVLTGCDSNALLNNRIIETGLFNSIKDKLIKPALKRSAERTEQKFGRSNILVHFVGNADNDYYQKHTGHQNSFYSPHPHYNHIDREIRFHEHLKLLIAGANDYYMNSDMTKIKDEMIRNNAGLKDSVSITFLGRGWSTFVDELRAAGYTCQEITWVDDYIEEINKYDVQLVPIVFGTGTKGKVLDAIGNGLLCIGSKYALENISVKDGESCIEYTSPKHAVQVMKDVITNKAKYEVVAETGRANVRRFHAPDVVSRQFFNEIRKYYSL